MKRWIMSRASAGRSKGTIWPESKTTSDADIPGKVPGDSDIYRVDRLLNMRHMADRSREFLVKWEGWSAEHDSWEPEAHILDEEMLCKFLRVHTQPVIATLVEPECATNIGRAQDTGASMLATSASSYPLALWGATPS